MVEVFEVDFSGTSSSGRKMILVDGSIDSLIDGSG